MELFCPGSLSKASTTQLSYFVELKTLAKRKRQSTPLKAVKIAFEKKTGIILFSGALLYAERFAVLAALPLHLQEKYQFNTLQIDLCYLPYGLESLISRWIAGKLPDWNYWFVLPSFDLRAMKVGH
jgi:predicted MFS family arabinose efflux permease